MKRALDGVPPELRPLALAILPALVRAVRDELADGDALVDVAAALPIPRRRSLAIARSGALVGAVKVGRRWLARRSSIEAWLQTQKAPRANVHELPVANSGRAFDQLRRALA